MTKSDALERVKAFMMTNQLVNEELQQAEKKYAVELGHLQSSSFALEEAYYPQFDAAVRAEAAEMGKHYEAFYCLEKTIRALVAETLEVAEKSANWWETSRIAPNIRSEVATRMQRELDSGVTRRSEDPLDYTTFGELSGIITSNWDVFGSIFSSKKAVEKVMANLNTLRGPIAHCSPLADDEVQRLQLTVRDWFRLME